jgi:hypothetical protein
MKAPSQEIMKARIGEMFDTLLTLTMTVSGMCAFLAIAVGA